MLKWMILIKFAVMKQIILFLTICICVSCTKAQNTYILAVGINDYNAPGVRDLRCCENDVRDFCTVMKKQKAQVVQCTGKAATKNRILASLKALCENATSNDAVIFFFSGHGYHGGFCPVDMTRNSAAGLTYQEVLAVMKRSRAKRKLVIADACFSGGLRKNKSSSKNQANNCEVMFFLSSRTNEFSQEVPNGTNGQFTKFLVRALGGGADYNRNRIITAKELFKFVSEGVAVATGGRQHPVMWGKFDDNMPVTDWRK